MNYEVGELQRQLANLIRVGVISELDEGKARVKVKVAGLTSDWLPWGTGRAGSTRSVSMPSVGEQVLVFSPYGDTAQAVVGPSIFQDSHPSPSASKDKETTIYPDGTTVEYDSGSNTLTVTVSGSGNVVVNCKVATINAETSAKIDTPTTTCTGDLVVEGSITYGQGMTGTGGATINGGATVNGNFAAQGGTFSHEGKNVGSTHAHSGVTPGGANTASPI